MTITSVRSAMTIGAVSSATGCKIETIRYYERIGLVPKPGRTSGGHRYYAAAEVRRLRFIRRARELGFPIEQIRDLLALDDGRPSSCREVASLTTAHLQHVRERRRDLERLERLLAKLASQCRSGKRPDCPVIAVLAGERPADA